MLMVTHDQREAVALAHRIAVMHEGSIVQYDEPKVFYRRPANRYVAEFFGWKNFISALAIGDEVESALGSFVLEGLSQQEQTQQQAGSLTIRPEAALPSKAGAQSAQIISSTYEGMQTYYTVMCKGEQLLLALPSSYNFNVGETLRFDLDPSMIWFVKDVETKGDHEH